MFEISIVRHADTNGSDTQTGLSKVGIEETRDMGYHYGSDKIYPCKMTSPAHLRFTSTLALMASPELTPAQIPNFVSDAIEGKVLAINDNLDYLPATNNPQFQHQMNVAYKEKNNLKFLFNDAEKYNIKDNKISSARSMYKAIAETVQDHVSTQHNIEIPFQKTVICAREFFFPSFKLELLNRIDGGIAADKYIEWYSETIERNDSARVKIGKIAIIGHETEIQIVVTDEFNELVFGVKHTSHSQLGSMFDKRNLC